MPGDPEEYEDENWFRPTWETEDDENLDPARVKRSRQPAKEPDFHHPLLHPLARAQDALARLETGAELASASVAEGLRARMAFREAAGWLAHAHVWIHPHDLALRDRGLTSSYGVAFGTGRLPAEIPSTTALETYFDEAPSDIAVNQALRLARLWRLGEMGTWRPLAHTGAVQETLQALGVRALPDAEIEDWRAVVDGEQAPALIKAGRAARDWMNRPGVARQSPAGIFLGACLWCDKKPRRPIALPFWSASTSRHQRLELRTGLRWMTEYLDCVGAAAQIARAELDRLRRAEEKGDLLKRTARSRLPDAIDAMVRLSIVTARDLAASLDVTPQAALGLLHQLVEAGIVREATGRAAWRAFTLI